MLENNIPAILYHYCSLYEFMDIISGKHFMLKDIQKSDDYSDLSHIIKLLYERIQLKESQIIAELNSDKDNIYRTIPLGILKKQINMYKDIFIPFIYVLRLSSNYDKWYMYDNYAADICLGIKSSIFTVRQPDNKLVIKKVNYSTDDLEKSLDNIIEEYVNNYIKNEKNNDNTTGESFEIIWKYILEDLTYDTIFYKSPYFADEQEYRFAYNSTIRKGYLENDKYFKLMNIQLNSSIQNEKFSLSKVNFYTEDNKLISYRYYTYNDFINSIESIYINPLCNVSHSDIENILYTSKVKLLNTKIFKSKLTQ